MTKSTTNQEIDTSYYACCYCREFPSPLFLSLSLCLWMLCTIRLPDITREKRNETDEKPTNNSTEKNDEWIFHVLFTLTNHKSNKKHKDLLGGIAEPRALCVDGLFHQLNLMCFFYVVVYYRFNSLSLLPYAECYVCVSLKDCLFSFIYLFLPCFVVFCIHIVLALL